MKEVRSSVVIECSASSSATPLWITTFYKTRRACALLFVAVIATLSSCAKLPRQYVLESGSSSSAKAVPFSPEMFARLDINKASAIELESLPGIGKVLAERIISHRTKYGPFRRAEHLMMVRGMSERKFREIQGLVSVN